jgi:hypothetical protein
MRISYIAFADGPLTMIIVKRPGAAVKTNPARREN